MRSRIPGIVLGVFVCAVASAQTGVVEVSQDFSEDPGWEGIMNRVVAENAPEVVQEFGWTDTDHCGARGEIGGRVIQSRTPAWYGMPLGKPLSLKDKFTVSGKIALMPLEPGEAGGVAYFGFFNSTRQEWRPWSSLAVRISYEDSGVMFGMDYMSGLWNANGYETDFLVPADRKVHTWVFSYDPDATIPTEWPDPELKTYLSGDRQTAPQIHERMKKDHPGLTLEQVTARLQDALAEGLISFFRRSGGPYYTLNETYNDLQGKISFQIDDLPPYIGWAYRSHIEAPTVMDRFGIFNMQIYHRATHFYLGDLTINGENIDLSTDPHWEGHGNRVRFTETDFQRNDYGYSETNWAGARPGEIGGSFYRKEPNDPVRGYYADEAGGLTLDDPIRFSGNVCFVGGGTDAGMFIGYFNSQDALREYPGPRDGWPIHNTLGIDVDGPTRVGYYFYAHCSPKRQAASSVEGPVFLPTRERHAFSFAYDPAANNGVGRITVTLDDKTFSLDLTPEQRKAGATFDRFGLMTKRVGGKYVTLYFDDLTYTVKRAADYKPVFHEQEVTTVPYPRGGREY